MATHSIPELLSMWDKDKLSAEQAIGQLLQTVEALEQRLAAAERRIRQLEQAQSKPQT
jgi:hypothetical protein